ncbi:CbiX/SirB N-terminal domain-containing protein [Demequina sp. SYSU T00192]|uniref:CbiX/SirB N-terminal domain-containing protein n=1 Tax=Demequina litoralis TaxID=3051660 RepID=A0ABT8GCZ1_9MICO|nr:CbiX/SirB N-terminal domain-containing protein [Demequina sp. SYSU T00192]MDN4476539.1 CbiX/SirB N-terminal domain-containing protein [Demequina sp. SYSU T00192]
MSTLIACAHGTRDEDGQATILKVVEDIRGALPQHDVRDAYVDVHGPYCKEVVADVEPCDGTSAVVVPLLLAGGYHVYHDIAEAVKGREDVAAASALGPDPRLVDIVMDRIHEAHIPETTTLILAAAGSSDPRSTADTEAAAEMLRARWSGPVRIGYAAGIHPTVADAVADARANGEDGEVAVASFLLAPGFFQKRLGEAGADYVTAPLAPHPRLVEIVLDRYRDAGGS